MNDWVKTYDQIDRACKRVINSQSPSWLDTTEIDEANMSESNSVWHDIAEEYAAEVHTKSIRDRQVGGDHYKKHDIQPWDVIDSYQLDFYTGNVIKYVLRQKGDRLQDLEKAKHYLEKAIEMEKAR